MEDFKAGHRKRIKQKYIENKSSFVNDYELLELLLTYAIPRRDVKPVAKQLINTCGSLNNVLNTSIENLEKIEGVGENTAVLISLVKEIRIRANKSKNAAVTRFDTEEEVLEYFFNLLSEETNEKMVVASLDNVNRIINTHIVSEGTSNFAAVNPRKIVEAVIADNASGVIIAHNHPSGISMPSANDLDFTLNIRNLLASVGVRLIDHVIVGEDDAKAISSIPEFKSFFNDKHAE